MVRKVIDFVNKVLKQWGEKLFEYLGEKALEKFEEWNRGRHPRDDKQVDVEGGDCQAWEHEHREPTNEEEDQV